MKKLSILFFSFVLTCVVSHAQNAQRITEIVNSPVVTYSQASYVVATYLGLVSDDASFADSFNELQNKFYFAKDVKEDDKISLKNLCSLYAKATDFKGGAMYTITKKSPRYSYKEFYAKEFFKENTDPDMTVTGIEAINLFNNVIE